MGSKTYFEKTFAWNILNKTILKYNKFNEVLLQELMQLLKNNEGEIIEFIKTNWYN